MQPVIITGEQLANELRNGARLLSIAAHVLFNPFYAQLSVAASTVADHPHVCQVAATLISDPEFHTLLAKFLDLMSTVGASGVKNILGGNP